MMFESLIHYSLTNLNLTRSVHNGVKFYRDKFFEFKILLFKKKDIKLC